MRDLVFVVLIVTLLFVIPSCSETTIESLPKGAFEYTSYDSLGTVIAKGWLLFDCNDSTYVKGEWRINKVGNPQRIGPQIGDGNLVGSFIEDKLHIELNPDFADNNLGLIGDLEENEYSGKWIYSSFIGITNWGRFEALRK
jgi:hypothetical protein